MLEGVTRRDFLFAASLTGVATSIPALVVRVLDGGFFVEWAGERIWTVTRLALEGAFGRGASVRTSGSPERPQLDFSGVRLLADDSHALRLNFVPSSVGRWRVSAEMRGGVVRATFPEQDLPKVGDVAWALRARLPLSVASDLRRRLVLAATTGAADELRLGPNLWPRFRPLGAPRLHTLAHFEEAVLLPGEGRTDDELRPLARFRNAGTTIVERTIGTHVGRTAFARVVVDGLDTVRAGPAEGSVVLTGDARGRPLGIEVRGRATLTVSDGARLAFRADGGATSTLTHDLRTAPHRTKVELRSAGPWLVQTAHAGFEAYGEELGPVVEVEGSGGTLRRFHAGALLSHCTLRLPLGGRDAGQFAETGRLDFERQPGTRCRFVLAGLAPPPGDATVRLAPARGEPAVELSLHGAKLTVMRSRDLLALRFGFRRMILQAGDFAPRLRMAPLSAGTACPGEADEPLLIVELPPQHIQERAFARQIAGFIEPAKTLDPADMAALGDEAKRQKVNERLTKELVNGEDLFRQFSDLYRWVGRVAPAQPSAQDRKYAGPPLAGPEVWWVGSEGMRTVRERQVARFAAEALRRRRVGQVLGALPLGLAPAVVGDVLRRNPVDAAAALQGLLSEAANRSDEHLAVQRAYRDWREEEAVTTPAIGALPASVFLPGWPDLWANDLAGISDNVRTQIRNLKPVQDPFDGYWGRIEPRLRSALIELWEDPFPDALPVEARAAGTTRLAFALPCVPVTRPYSLETLLDWDEWDLRVSHRSERFEPTGQEGLRNALRVQGIEPAPDVRTRLNSVFAAARGPGLDETAIHLPARLQLSPASDARFRQPGPTLVGAPDAIWRAELREVPNRRATLRAIASPDFNPAAFNDPGQGHSPPRGHGDSWLVAEGAKRPPPFRAALDAFDRHQLVGLSGIHGLPVISRLGTGKGEVETSQLTPPPGYVLEDVFSEDAKSQALYAPRVLPARLLSLSAFGAWLDLDAPFVPPAALRDGLGRNLFDAFSIERWRTVVAAGREILTEVLYKGFLFPLSHRATLVKVTERRCFPPGTAGKAATAYEVQRLFIQVGKPTKTHYVGQPFAGRGWPPSSVTLLTRQTPDLLPQVLDRATEAGEAFDERLSGRLDRRGGVGLVFWPRTEPSRGVSGLVRFRFSCDEDAGSADMPLVFVDNQAAHDPATMEALHRHYNDPNNVERRTVSHNGARRAYATNRLSGDTRVKTLSWLVRADSRLPELSLGGPLSPFAPSNHAMDAALEADDQPPFYPRLQEAELELDGISNLTGNVQRTMRATFLEAYLRDGFGPEVGPEDKPSFRTETFLRLADGAPPPPFGLGANGDRVGGVGRPSQDTVAVARTGPVGGVAPKGSSAQFALPEKLEDFFNGEAKLLGLVSFTDLLKAAEDLGAAADLTQAPVLRDTLAYAEQGIDTVARSVRAVLTPVRNKFLATAVLREVYPGLAAALDAMEQATADALAGATAADALVETTTRLWAAGRSLAREVERVSAAPLGGIGTLAQRVLADLQSQLQVQAELLKKVADAALRERLDALRGMALDRARTVLMPVSEAVARAAVFEADLAALAGLDLGKPFDDAWQKAITAPLPATLPAFRAGYAANLVFAPPAGLSPESAAALVRFQKAVRQAIAELPLPKATTDLYAMGVALLSADVEALWKAASDEALAALREWLAPAAGAICGAATEALRDVATLFAASTPLPPPCAPLGCSPSLGTATLCAALWDYLCAHPGDAGLRASTQDFAVAVTRFERARRMSLSPGDACAPPAGPAGDFVAGLEALHTAFRAFAVAGPEWLEAAAAAARDGAEEEAARRAIRLMRAVLSDVPLDEVRAKALLGAAHLDPSVRAALTDPLEQAAKALDALRRTLDDDTASLPKIRDSWEELAAALEALSPALRGVLDRALLAAVAPAKVELDDLASQVLGRLQTLFRRFVDLRDQAAQKAREAEASLGSLGDPQEGLVTALYLPCEAADECAPGQEAVDRELLRLEPVGTDRAVALLDVLIHWRAVRPAPLRLLDRLSDRLLRAATARALQLLDLDGLKQTLSEELKNALPTKRRLNYDYKLPLKPLSLGDIIAFTPRGEEKDQNLVLRAQGEVDLMGREKPRLDVAGTCGPFAVEIKEFITFEFGSFELRSKDGGALSFDAPLKGVQLGSNLDFLAELAQLLALKDGNSPPPPNGPPLGIYVLPRLGKPGVRAGYGLALPAFSIGNIGFANVVLDAHCELPFDHDEAQVVLSLSSPEHPFLISAAPYGGGGHVQLTANARGLVAVDLSLQWGGAAVVSYGPLEGIGHVMVGISMVLRGTGVPELSGVFSAGFVGHVACFGIAASFYLAMGVPPGGGPMYGKATLTFAFSLGTLKKEFKVEVTRNEGTKLGGQHAAAGQPPAYATDPGDARPRILLAAHPHTATPPPTASYAARTVEATSDIPSPLQDWKRNSQLFDMDLRAVGRRRR